MTQMIANRYRLLDKLGEGGMGTVHTADDRLTGDTVAIKQLRLGAATLRQTPQTLDKKQALILAQEFRTLASLHHPNIIGVLDYGFVADQSYYVMQYLPNALTIVEYAAEMDTEARVQLLVQLLQALIYIHRRGIAHRDIKPGNVLVSATGMVKLLDFGLAIEASQAKYGVVGTLPYVAPEMLAGRKLTLAADLYSFGVLAFELFTSKTPFQHIRDVNEMMNAIANTPPDFTAFNLDSRLLPFIKCLLAKDPLERYASAQDTLNALLNAFAMAAPDETGIRDSFLQSAAFVGREAELTQLQDALKTARSGQGSTWLIGGESGVGKSRLLDELRIHSLTTGVTVLQGQGVEGGGFPFQLWRDLLRHIALSVELSDLEASILKAIVPDISTLLERDVVDAPTLEGAAAQERLIRTMVDVLRRYSLGNGVTQPLLLVLEDLQWAIESLQPLKLLNRFVRDLPMLIIGSYRDDERAELPDELPTMKLMKLQRLSETEIATLSQAMIGAVGQQEELVEFLQHETEGNVFFLIEVLRVLADEAGSLSDVGLVTLPESVMPDTIKQISQQRLANLPEHYQDLLRLAAILGRQIDNRILRKFADEAGIVLEDWFIACAQVAILELRDRVWRFVHDKLREGTLQTLSEEDVPTYHQRIAEAIEETYPDDKQYWLLLTQLWRKANHHAKELHYIILQGMELAEQAGFSSYQQAHGLFQRGWQLREHADDSMTVDLLLGLGLALVGIHKPDDAQKWFEQASELAQKLNLPEKKAWALNGLARSMLHQADKETLYKLLDEATQLAEAVGDKHRLSDVLVTKGYIEAQYSEFNQSEATFEHAGKLLREIKHQGWLATVLNNVGKLQQLTGEYEKARRNLEEAQALALSVKYFNTAVLSTSNLGILAYFMKRYLEATQYYAESIRLMKEHDDIAGLSHVWVLRLFAEMAMGDTVSAKNSLQQALKDRHDPDSVFSNIYITMGAIHLDIDDNPTQAAMRLGLLYQLGGKDPFIAEWLQPLRDKLLENLDERLLQSLMKKGESLELGHVIAEIESTL
jgi:serine/threonine protein kinase/tetratricopeptide (TPR) repeat protein